MQRLLQKSIIRQALPAEYVLVADHYKICGYGGGLAQDDRVFVAVGEQIVGAVRICFENGVDVLRGMYVKPEFQQKGIGASMLAYLKDHIEMNGCYCLPYKHLERFYAKIGFAEISIHNAPAFLAARLEKYLTGGNREIIIMKVKDDI